MEAEQMRISCSKVEVASVERRRICQYPRGTSAGDAAISSRFDSEGHMSIDLLS